MNHWMTVHWPPHEGRPADEVAGGLWVPDGREQAAVEVRAGDLVLIYHPQTGRTMVEALPDGSVRHHRCQRGREGLVGIARARGPVAARSGVQPERYSDGSSIWWRWHAELELLTTAGFVPRPRVCAALGFKGSYNFRGFGDAHSGLKRITPAVFERLLAEFRASSPKRLPAPQPGPTGRFGGGEESTAHRALKEYVAANCERVFGEVGLAHRHTEYDFPTGDRADVVLEDRYGTDLRTVRRAMHRGAAT